MNKARTSCIVLALIACLLPACSQMPQVGVVPITGLENPLPPEAAPAVDIQNHRGTVTVIVDPKAPGPDVRAVARGAGSPAEVRWTAATMDMDNGLPVLRVLSTPEDTGAPDGPVDITVTMPAVGGVRVKNDGGPVVLRDVRGAIEVHSSLEAPDGDAIYIETRHALTEPLLLNAQAGGIVLRMGQGSAGQLIANTDAGRVIVDAAKAKITGARMERGIYTATINEGEHEHRLTTQTGDVTVTIRQWN
jgi:hypothetical protein